MDPVLQDKARVQLFYDFVAAYAPSLNKLLIEDATTKREILERAELETPGDVLEIGCGIGVTTQILAEETRVVGVDLSRKSLDHAEDRCNPEETHFVVGDGETLPFGSNRFDTVVSVGVFGHTQNAGQILKEMHRVTRPGGQLVMAVPRRPESKIHSQLLSLIITSYREAEVTHLCRSAGWADIRCWQTSVSQGYMGAIVLEARSNS